MRTPERNPKHPTTLQEAILYFADPDRCLDYVVSRRWPDGVSCPTCGSTMVRFLKTQRRWKCGNDHPKRQFSAKVGTIFEDSPLGFEKWLPAMWLLANCKNGISSYELGRALKVTQKSAWFMLQRIRLAMQDNGTILGGNGSPIEVDETYIGGQARRMNKQQYAKAMEKGPKKGPRAGGKAIVLGMLERRGKVVTKVVTETTRATLAGHISRHVERGSEVFSDKNPSYDGFVAPHYFHDAVDHTAEEYVRGNVHINGIENYWSLVKRALRGTYISVEPFHLFRYLDEQAFRFNLRKVKGGDGERFDEVLDTVAGRRLTYKQLIGDAPADAG